MKNSINVYWAVEEHFNAALPLLSNKPESVISNFIKNNKDNEYIKCPAFSREFNNTFIYKSPYSFSIDINPITLDINSNNTIPIHVKNPNQKHFSIFPHIVFFSDESLEMSQIPASLNFNNFTNNTNIFSGKYNIGKWFRPLSLDFILKKPNINVKKDNALFYLKFHTDKKVNFINFRYNKEILKIQNSCLGLKSSQPNYRFKDIYNFFLKIGYHKKLLKLIKQNITDLK
jgi:hypothetical protein